MTTPSRAHPYIPSTAPDTLAGMLAEIGVADAVDLHSAIPSRLRAPDDLGLPTALESEVDLRRYFEDALAENTSCREVISFLGGGCWQHYVPAVCEEVASRGEFYTAMIGITPQGTHGAYQALFEYQSMVSELVGMDVTPVPTYDWGAAAGSAVAMASRLSGRSKVILPRNAGPQRRRQIATRMHGALDLVEVPSEEGSGLVDLQALSGALDDETAAVYLEMPSYLGGIDHRARRIGEMVHEAGGLLIVGADPSSLGVLASPGSYGADAVVGDLQPLGLHMNFGGGSAGFISTRLDERWIAELPTIVLVAIPTERDGEYAYFWGNFETTSYITRESAHDFMGTVQVLAGVIVASYLSVMGPQGMRELGEGILRRRAYAIRRLAEVPGVAAGRLSGPGFKEFVVDFNATGATVGDVNAGLLERGILGGAPLTRDYPELGESALYAVTELHTRTDLDRLADALREVLA